MVLLLVEHTAETGNGMIAAAAAAAGLTAGYQW